jgi:hypothetical protein
MQAGLVYIATTTSKLVVSSAITPIVNSTLSLLSTLRTSGLDTATLQDIIHKHDIECTLQTIEATCLSLGCTDEPFKTACTNVTNGVHQIHTILTRIADITATHNAGYISRWRQLQLEPEISQLDKRMTILNKRFRLLCDIRSAIPPTD